MAAGGALQKNKTLIEMLEHRAQDNPIGTAFTFENSPCTFSNLWRQINRFAALLLDRGLKPKNCVLTVIPNSSEFFYVFYGVQRAGGIAVPVFPGSGVERILKIARLCDAAFIFISKSFPGDKVSALKQGAKKNNSTVFFVEENFPGSGESVFPRIVPEDVSFIQFTSGSTGNPKGVQLTHHNLLTNIEQMIAGMEITKEDFFVSWLPVYHDMGLILMSMVPFYLGAGLALLPTGLLHIKNWLKAVNDHKATFTAAPDFAYRLCLLYVRDPENYDLSSLRVALNAAETVRSTTISRFEKKFNLENVMLPAYGLAEATVGVCSWPPGKKVKVDERGFVSVGTPFPAVEIQVVQDNRPAEPGEIGEILVRSKANTRGYYRNPEAAKELFAGENLIKTGDLGYVDEDGDYFIVGRQKNIIIQGGYNISAREIEEMVDAFPFVRRSAAVGIDRGRAEGEQVYVFIEAKLKKSQLQNKDELMNLTVEIVQKFNETFGFRPGRVYLVEPRTIPITANGKIQYLLLKEQYLNKTLEKEAALIFPDY